MADAKFPNGGVRKRIIQDAERLAYARWVHRHNSFLGSIAHMQGCVVSMQASGSMTPSAMYMLDEIASAIGLLQQEVYTFRVEPDGSVATIQHEGSKKHGNRSIEDLSGD